LDGRSGYPPVICFTGETRRFEMTDAPTPDEVVQDINQGNQPPSLGDTARTHDDPVVGQSEDVPEDGGHIQEES
jgi:hypothetical protein